MSSLSHERLFFALYPPKSLRQAIYMTGQQQNIEGKQHAPELLHMTLAFLGNVASSEVEGVIDAVKPLARLTGFTLQLTQCTVWKKPRLVCLTPDDPPAALTHCVQQLTQLLLPCGYRADKRPYSPHVTLVRHYPKEAEIGNTRLNVPLTWEVDSFCLMRSENTSTELRYQLVQRWFFAT